MKKYLLFITLVLFFFNNISVQKAFGATTTIDTSPTSGSYNKPFRVKIVVDGHGEKFNAAQATMNISSNLSIADLTLGDCNFSFLRTPSIQNPSFAGIIISNYSTKCTAYTLELSPKTKGQATIKFSNASVKRYGDAAEILSSTKDGVYNLTVEGSVTKATLPIKNTSQKGLYTLYLKVSSGESLVNNATVMLENVAKKKKQEAKTNGTGIAHFSNLEEGVYDAIVQQGSKKVGETIVNVKGPNKVLNLGINLETQKNNPLMKANTILTTISTNPLILIGILVGGILSGLLIAFFTIKLLGIKKKHKQKTSK